MKAFIQMVMASYVAGFDLGAHDKPDAEAVGPYARQGILDWKNQHTLFLDGTTPSIDASAGSDDTRADARAIVSHFRHSITELNQGRVEPKPQDQINALYHVADALIKEAARGSWASIPPNGIYLGKIVARAPVAAATTEKPSPLKFSDIPSADK